MICLLCDSKTQITNSRYVRSFAHTWRRHACTRCNAVFTTRESIDMGQSYRILYDDGSTVVFNRNHLFLSIHDALSHRSDSIESAGILTDTILATIIKKKRLAIQRHQLIDITKAIIMRFDRTAYVRYVSLHSNG